MDISTGRAGRTVLLEPDKMLLGTDGSSKFIVGYIAIVLDLTKCSLGLPTCLLRLATYTKSRHGTGAFRRLALSGGRPARENPTESRPPDPGRANGCGYFAGAGCIWRAPKKNERVAIRAKLAQR